MAGAELHDAENLVCNPASILIGRYFLLFLFIHDPPIPFHGFPLWTFIIYALVAEYLTTARGTPYCIDVVNASLKW